MFIHDCIDFSVFLLRKRNTDLNMEYNKYNIMLKNQCKISLYLFTIIC